jgi:glutamate-1-semialdehyde 2,1-aminomutase
MAAENGWRRLAELGAYFEDVVTPVLADAPFDMSLVRLASMFWMAPFAAEPPRSPERIDARAAGVYAYLFHALLDRGIALAPSAYEIGFLSLAHRRADIDRFAGALHDALRGPGLARFIG